MLRSLLGSELGCAEYLADKKVSTTKNGAQLDVMVQAAVNECACFSQSVVSQYCAMSAQCFNPARICGGLKDSWGQGGGIHPLKEKMFYEVIIIMYGGTLNPGIVEGQWQT